jgi:hypothetical protein
MPAGTRPSSRRGAEAGLISVTFALRQRGLGDPRQKAPSRLIHWRGEEAVVLFRVIPAWRESEQPRATAKQRLAGRLAQRESVPFTRRVAGSIPTGPPSKRPISQIFRRVPQTANSNWIRNETRKSRFESWEICGL